MVLMGTNYGVYNQQQTPYYNNNSYNTPSFNRASFNGSVNKSSYFQNIEKTSSRVYFPYNFQSQNASSPPASYYQPSQHNIYPPTSQINQSPKKNPAPPGTPATESRAIKLSKSKTLSKNFKVIK